MSEINVVLKSIHLAVRALLVLACAFWALILVEVLPAFFGGGMTGVRRKLMQAWGITGVDLPWSCSETVQLIHEGYTDLFVFVLLTWGLLEVKRFLDRRIAAAENPEAVQNLSRPEGQSPTL